MAAGCPNAFCTCAVESPSELWKFCGQISDVLGSLSSWNQKPGSLEPQEAARHLPGEAGRLELHYTVRPPEGADRLMSALQMETKELKQIKQNLKFFNF